MSADRAMVIAWIRDLAGTIVSDAEDVAEIARRLDLSAAMDGQAFAAETLDLARVIAENVGDEAAYFTLGLVAVEPGDTRDAVLVLSAVAFAVAAGRVDWLSRQSARFARTVMQARAEEAYAVASRLGPDLYGWLRTLAQTAMRLISEIAADATPMVRVMSPLSMPSTVAAYQLYGNANRAGQLVGLAQTGTPMLMPSQFDALAE